MVNLEHQVFTMYYGWKSWTICVLPAAIFPLEPGGGSETGAAFCGWRIKPPKVDLWPPGCAILILSATLLCGGEVALSKMRCSGASLGAITFESGTQSGQVTDDPLHLQMQG